MKTIVRNVQSSIKISWILLVVFSFMEMNSSKAQINIVPLGNSITQAIDTTYSYRYYLWKKFVDEGLNYNFVGTQNLEYSYANSGNPGWPDYLGQSFDRDHEGHYGWSAKAILEGVSFLPDEDSLSGWIQNYTPDIALVHLGHNDLLEYGATHAVAVNRAYGRLLRVVDTLRQYHPNIIILFAKIIPTRYHYYNGTDSSYNVQYDRVPLLNDLITNLPTEKFDPNSPIWIVDQYTGFDTITDLAIDGVHPNELGEEKMAQKWFESIKVSLGLGGIWWEDFEPYVDNSGYTGPGTTATGDYPDNISKWTLDVSGGTLSNENDWFMVNEVAGNNLFEARDVDGPCVWLSEIIDISGYIDVSFELVATEVGNHETVDYLNVEYRIGTGPWILIQNWNGQGSVTHTLDDDFNTQTPTVTSLMGASLQLRITISNTAGDEYIRFDDILVDGTLFTGPANPTGFTASAFSSSEIDLDWIQNVAGDDVLVSWSSDGTFGTPVNGTTYIVGDPIPGGGTVIYYGPAQHFDHTGLTSQTQYFYKAWSFDGLQYSLGVIDDATTPCGFPNTLPWFEDFENVGPTTIFTANEPSINGACYWAYEKNNQGRLRFQYTSHNGSQAAAFDDSQNGGNYSINYITATLDLSNYSASTDLELSFWHRNYSDEDQSNDKVWIRGSDSDTWIEIYDLDDNSSDWLQVSGLDIDALISSEGQTITSTFQLRFGQEDNYPLTDDGRVFDDISITGALPISFIWNGNTSTDWNTPANWSDNTVPISAANVIIPSSVTSGNWPVYNGNMLLGTTCEGITLEGVSELSITGDLSISSGKALTYSDNALVKIGGNWTNNGTFNPGTGKVDFNGTNTANINVPPPGTVFLINDDISTWPGNWNGDIGTDYGQYNSVNSNNAGGAPNEVRFYWDDATDSRRLYYNAVNTSGLTSITLEFKHFVDDWSSGGHDYVVKVQYSTDGSNWSDSDWSIVNPTSDVGPETVTTILTSASHGVGSSTYYIAFTITDYLYDIWYWYIDDVKLFYDTPGVETYYDLVISKTTNPMSTNGDINVDNNLTIMPNAYFTNTTGNMIDVTGDVLLDADPTTTASFIDNGTMLVGGTTIVEKSYVDGRWHFISSPLSNAVSNVFLGIYLKYWDEADYSWTYITATNYPMEPGAGYEIWSTLGNPTVEYIGGTLNNGTISPTVTATDTNLDLSIGNGEGWNLLGNPFPSAIDLGTENSPVPGYTWTNLDNTVYFWNGSQYSVFNMAGSGTGTNGGTQYIPSMQAFFVKANDFGPILTIPTSAKLHSVQDNYKSLSENKKIRFTIDGNGYIDEMVIGKWNEATDDFDSKYDAYKFNGIYEAPQLYSIWSDMNLTINVMSELNDKIIPVGVEVGADGEYCVKGEWLTLSNSDEFSLYLEDIKNSLIMKLTSGEEYKFESHPNDAIHRFNVIFKYHNDIKKSSENESISIDEISIYSHDDRVYISVPEKITADVYIYNMTGQLITEQGINGGLESIRVTDNSGYYIVKVLTKDDLHTDKVFIK